MFSYGMRRSAAPCSNRTQNKSPVGIANGAFTLATSYSRTACRRTTIGAAAFHFRVRNGNGWCHYATVTRVRNRTGSSLLSQRRKREAESLRTSVNRSIRISKENDFQSAMATRKSLLIRLHLHTGSKLEIRMTNLEILRLRFLLRSFVSSVC